MKQENFCEIEHTVQGRTYHLCCIFFSILFFSSQMCAFSPFNIAVIFFFVVLQSRALFIFVHESTFRTIFTYVYYVYIFIITMMRQYVQRFAVSRELQQIKKTNNISYSDEFNFDVSTKNNGNGIHHHIIYTLLNINSFSKKKHNIKLSRTQNKYAAIDRIS